MGSMKRILSLVVALAIVTVSMLTVPGLLPVAHAASYTAEVVGGWLRLRSAPSFSAPTIVSYFTGTRFTVLSVSNGWARVRTPDGLDGYSYASFLRKVDSTPSISGTAYVISSNGRGVRLRSGPGQTYSVIGVYNVGTKATILKSSGNWYYIHIGSQYGYMMSQFLSTGTSPAPTATPTPTSVPSGGYSAYVTSQNGKGVRLRAGAGTGYSVLGLVEVGTALRVLKYGATWCMVQVNNLTGYMMTQYITTTQPGTKVTAVSLNTYKPNTGTVLTVRTSPSNATVTYKWYDHYNNLLGTQSTLTVSNSMKGSRIRCVVTGYGAYTGSVSSSWTSEVTAQSTQTRLTSVGLTNYAPVPGLVLYAALTPADAEADISWYNTKGNLIGSGFAYTVKTNDIGSGIYCMANGKGSTVGTCLSPTTLKVTAASPAPSATPSPTPVHTAAPTLEPQPTQEPTPAPTAVPVIESETPTPAPSATPVPTAVPTAQPTDDPGLLSPVG